MSFNLIDFFRSKAPSAMDTPLALVGLYPMLPSLAAKWAQRFPSATMANMPAVAVAPMFF